jgi:uncharacterized protein (DUF1778 family)
MVSGSLKSEKLSLRLTPEAKRLLQRAANDSHRSVGNFVLESAMARAREAVPTHQTFGLSPDRWKAFLAALDAPTTTRS